MINRLGLVWIAGLILAVMSTQLGLAACSPSDFSVAIVRASEYNPSNLPYGIQTNFTKNQDFNNTNVMVSIKTNCTCTPSKGLVLYNKNTKIATIYDGLGKDGGQLYSFTLGASYVSAGLFDHINVTCDDRSEYSLVNNFMYSKDEDAPTLVRVTPKNNTIVPNNTLVNTSFWDPSGFTRTIIVLVNGRGVGYTSSTSTYWTNITIPLASNNDSWMHINITLEDNQGNTGHYYLVYYLDAKPPQIGKPVVSSKSPDVKYQWLPVNISFNVSSGLETHCVAELEMKGGKAFTIINETKQPINGIMQFSRSLDNLSDGEYNMYITCTDKGNLTNSTSYLPLFTLDNTPPNVQKVSPTTNATNTKTTLEVNATDATSGVSICYVYTNGNQGKMTLDSRSGLWYVDVPANPNTTIWYDVMCEDNAGHKTWLNKTLLVDTLPPTTTDNAPSGWQNHNVTITLTCSDTGAGCDTTYYSINGSRWEVGNRITITAEGNTTVQYYSTDKLRNTESQKTIYILIDKTAPDLVMTSPTNKTYNTSLIPINFTAKDPNLDQCTYNLDNKTYAIKCDENVTLNLTDGVHKLSLTAKDKAGNTNTKTVNFDIDTQPPNETYAYETHPTSIVVNASFLDPHLDWAMVYLAGSNQTCNETANSTSIHITCNFTNLTENTNYTIILNAKDTLGHMSNRSISVKTKAYPVAVIDYHPRSRFVWTKIFDASLSYDPDGNITSYFWNFGDGTNSTNITVTHRYTHPGKYTVKLTVTDNDGLKSTKEVQIIISRRAIGGGGGGGGWGGGGGGPILPPTPPKKSGIWKYRHAVASWNLEYDPTDNITKFEFKVSGSGRLKIIEPIPPGIPIDKLKVSPKWSKIEDGKLVWIVNLTNNETITVSEEIPGSVSSSEVEAMKPVIEEMPTTPKASLPVKVERANVTKEKIENTTSLNESKQVKSPVTGRIVQTDQNLIIGLIVLTMLVIGYVVLSKR